MTKFTTLCGYADAAVDNTEWDLFGNDATELKPTTTSAFEKYVSRFQYPWLCDSKF